MASNTSKVLALSSAQLVTTVVSVVSGVIFARYLSVLDYATYLQTFLAYDFVVPILTLGLPSALYYFLPGREKDERGIIIDHLMLLFISGCIFNCFLLCGGTDLLARRFENPQLVHTLKWLYAYPLYTFPVILAPVLIVKDKVKVNSYYHVFTTVTMTLGVIAASVITGNYKAPILVRVLFPLFVFPLVCYLSFKYAQGKWRLPSLSSMWTILKFSVPLGCATILGTLTLQISNMVVAWLCTPEDFAIYATGAREVPVVGIVTGSIAVVIMAEMSQKCKIGDQKAALELFRKSALIGGVFLFPVVVLLFIYAPEFINLLYTSKYMDSIYPFRVYLLYLPVRIVIYRAAFIALGKSKAILYRGIAELLITTLLCYWFVHLWGYRGAAWAAVFTLYFWSIPYNLYFLGKAFHCGCWQVLPWAKLGRVLVISIIAGILGCVGTLFCMPPLWRLVLGCGVGGMCYLAGIYWGVREIRGWLLFKSGS